MTATKTIGTAIDAMLESLQGLEPGQQKIVIETVCKTLSIELQSSVKREDPASAGLQQRSTTEDQTQKTPVTDIRTFAEQRQPKSAIQMACLVAFYLSEMAAPTERKETIATGDIEKYFKQAKFALPKRIEQLLLDAKSAGYFDTAQRGQYKLNAVGYNLAAYGKMGSSAPKSK